MTKKTIQDMTGNWVNEHRVTGLPGTMQDWCRELGLEVPCEPSGKDISTAWSEVRDIGMMTDMVKDVLNSIMVIKAASETTKECIEIMKQLQPVAEYAYAQMRMLGILADSLGVLIPPPDETEES